MKTSKLAAVLMAAIVTVSLAAISASAFDQPNMIAARNDLNKAENALRNATADKGGHRKRAFDLISQAIAEINLGIAFDRATPGDHRGGRRRNSHAKGGNFVSAADQPYMVAAKKHLQDALDNLQRATADKGGHRAKAIQLTREAISEIDKGIAFDRSN
jgi:hypothetical protein